MKQVVGDETIEKIETLECELRAIDRWDIDYWRKSRREAYERAAYLSRQTRRSEIMLKLRQSAL